jgi:hypothetical protein
VPPPTREAVKEAELEEVADAEVADAEIGDSGNKKGAAKMPRLCVSVPLCLKHFNVF